MSNIRENPDHPYAVAPRSDGGPAPFAEEAPRCVVEPSQPCTVEPHAAWCDERLVEACLSGDQRAWEALIHRYKRLIYSFPRRYGATPPDAADVFQLVCAELFSALPRLRRHLSLRAWIMTVSSHQAYHWKRRHLRRAQREQEVDAVVLGVPDPPSATLEASEEAAAVRAAVAQLPERDRALVQLLFYEDPPVPYHDVAARLGLAIGSIGLVRARCLRKLERILAQRESPAVPAEPPRVMQPHVAVADILPTGKPVACSGEPGLTNRDALSRRRVGGLRAGTGAGGFRCANDSAPVPVPPLRQAGARARAPRRSGSC